MVHQAARADLGESERDAFRTLAAATPQVRTQGIADFFADTEASSAATAPGERHSRLGTRDRSPPAARWALPRLPAPPAPAGTPVSR